MYDIALIKITILCANLMKYIPVFSISTYHLFAFYIEACRKIF